MNLLIYYLANLMYEVKKDLKAIRTFENIKTLQKEE